MAKNYPGRPLNYWLEMLRDHNPKRRMLAVEALGKIGLPAVIGVVRVFKDGHSADRYWALRALAQIGPPAREAIPLVKLALKNEHAEIRRAARHALENIDPKTAGDLLGFWYRLGRRLLRWPLAGAFK
jgi:HEAT repeat protein